MHKGSFFTQPPHKRDGFYRLICCEYMIFEPRGFMGKILGKISYCCYSGFKGMDRIFK